MTILKISDLRVWYGNIQVIHNIDLKFEEGKITAIIGSNGAGKTTIIKAISGMVKRKGSILYKNELLTEKSHKVVQKGIIQVPEGRKVFAGLTTEENLLLGAFSLKDRKEIQELLKQQYALFPRLEERKKQDAGTLSGGEQQMLAIARGLMATPEVLMLDEPSLGLAPIIINDVFEKIRAIREKGLTIILVEQNAKKSLSICDYAYVIENGHVVMQGTGEELLHNEKIAQAYLSTAVVEETEQNINSKECIMEEKTIMKDKLSVHIFKTRNEMGVVAAEDIRQRIARIIAEKDEAVVVFAAAPSQNEMLSALKDTDIDWTKVRALHMDEYIGLPEDHEAGFGNFLRRALFNDLPFKEVHYLYDRNADPEDICTQYSQLLKEYPPDLVLLGVGENGHLAFNDPAVADFNDPKLVKIVELDDICRMQQVNDGCFATFDEVPAKAITLTMSAILNIKEAVTVVPGKNKAAAIERLINGKITTECPASILRTHTNAVLYLDLDSASKIQNL